MTQPLTPEEVATLREWVDTLSDKKSSNRINQPIKGLGEGLALEVIQAIGKCWVEKEEDDGRRTG